MTRIYKNIIDELSNCFRKVTYDEDNEWNRAIDKAIKIIKQAEWIPIGERLPDLEIPVLLQAERDEHAYVGIRYNGRYICVTARKSEVTGMKPIAWMPLPEPYKK